VFPFIKISQSQGQPAGGIQSGMLRIGNVAVVEDLTAYGINVEHIGFYGV
jgi:hypothetical protein